MVDELRPRVLVVDDDKGIVETMRDILLASGYPAASGRDRANGMKATAYFSKPFDVEDLLVTIRGAVKVRTNMPVVE